MVQFSTSKPSITQEVSIIMNLCDKQPSIENSSKIRPGIAQLSSKKQGIKQTIDELNDFLMNIRSCGKESQCINEENDTINDHSKTEDNILEVEYYDTHKTNSNLSQSDAYKNTSKQQIPSFNNKSVSAKPKEIIPQKEQFSSAFLELLNSNVIEEFPNPKSNMFNLDMISCSDSVYSEEVCWNIMTEANPYPVSNKLNNRK